MKKILLSLSLAVLALSFAACSVIDDDRDGCAQCKGRTFQCHVHVTTSIDSLIIPQIDVDNSGALLSVLHNYYDGLFNPQSRTVGISFYDSTKSGLLSAESRTMQGNEATFTIAIPDGTERCQAVSPDNAGANSLSLREEPQYSGRQSMRQGQDSYLINLYPVDAQVALVARIDSTISAVQVFADSTSENFSVGDSTYSSSPAREVPLTLQPTASTASFSTYAATLFPSLGAKGNTRADESSGSWQLTVLATTATGSVTRTVLTIHKPLLPGDIRIITVTVGADGATKTSNSNVGASVTLNWKSGGEYNPDL